jgi:hypothetical protein
MINLSDGRLLFPLPEDRIREYCRLEVYHGYDDFHSVDSVVSRKDIEATKRIFSMIDQHEHSESISILNSSAIAPALSRVPDEELGTIPNEDWYKIKESVGSLFDVFHNIAYVGLAKTAKILHLKRPNLFPILDSYVVEFLTGVRLCDVSSRHALTDTGMRAMEIARKDIAGNFTSFRQLKRALSDLPIPLTAARMYDILCWTTWKWDILGIRQTTKWVQTVSGFKKETGHVSKTLLDPHQLGEFKTLTRPSPAPSSSSPRFIGKGCSEIETLEELDQIISKKEGFIVITDTTGNKIHSVSCRWVNRNGFELKVIVNRKRNGRYFWSKDYHEAEARFRAKDCRTCI